MKKFIRAFKVFKFFEKNPKGECIVFCKFYDGMNYFTTTMPEIYSKEEQFEIIATHER